MSATGTWDTIVVGAGSAGCVLANRPTADPQNRVLLVEAGGKDDRIWLHIPVGYLFALDNPRADWINWRIVFRDAASPTMMIAERAAEMILADAGA